MTLTKQLVNLGGVQGCFSWFWSLDESTRAAFITAVATFGTAVFTLIGVGVGLYLNRKSQQEERLLTLRREVYLNAANRYAASNQLLSLIADPLVDIRNKALPVLGEFAAAIAQVQVVGHECLMTASSRLHGEYIKTYSSMLTKRMRLEELKNRIDANNARLAQISNPRLQSEPAVRMATQEFSNIQIQNTNLWKEMLGEQLRLGREILDESDKLVPFATAALFAAKKEFGIQIEEAPYIKLVSESAQNVKESILRSLQEVESRIALIGQP